jgi:hypothetical protein
VNVEVPLLFEELYEEAIQSSVDSPVDGAWFVAPCVVAIVGKFQAGADLARSALSTMLSTEKLAREQVKLFQLGKKSRVEKQWRGRGNRKQSARS